MFKFTSVRDLVQKLESEVRPAWKQHSILRNKTADELLEMQISRERLCSAVDNRRCCVNEHLQPSSFRLHAFNGESAVTLDFVGKVETMDQSS
mmetsp:Transcript_88407/g.196572  ORF Transcript_88407/g.196572 Transcript_88407/m.196572 type:complete len:93 (-) Transcript_88407:34-312(-)